MPDRGSPNLARRQRLGKELRRLRERTTGMTGDEATTRLGWASNSKLSRIELGQTGVKPADLQQILDLYGVSDEQREELTALAEESRRGGAAPPAGVRLPEQHVALLEAQRDAKSIWLWAPQVIPGLFQTEDYTRALLAAWVDEFALPPSNVDRLVQARRLQEEVVLGRDPPPQVSVVLDESVLLREVGSAEVMRGQLNYLGKAARQAHIEIRVLPLPGSHLEVAGAFVYLKSPQIHQVPLQDIVFFDHLAGMEMVDNEGDVHQYSVIFNSLARNALSPHKSRSRIVAAANGEWRSQPAPPC